VHEGVARRGRAAVTKEDAAILVDQVNGIFDKIREWIPEALRWPVFEPRVEMRWTQMLLPQTVRGAPATPGEAADR
jgi:hypothetical protein